MPNVIEPFRTRALRSLIYPPGMEMSSADFSLMQLGRLLHDQNFRFVTVTPATHSRVNAASAEWASDIRDIFGWSKPFHADVIPRSMCNLLRTGRAIKPYQDGWRSAVRFSSQGEHLLMHSAFPTTADDAVFFGPDTYRFCSFVQDFLENNNTRIERVADIGCGSGAAGIMVARLFPNAEVNALDINAKALQYTKINAALAEADNVSVVHSNLLDDIDGVFDLVIANPPYMIDGGKRAYRHGGDQFGTALSLAMLDAALPRLAEGGNLLLYTGAPVVKGTDVFLRGVEQRLGGGALSWSYRELDPDVFGEEIGHGAYTRMERIAAIGLTVTRANSIRDSFSRHTTLGTYKNQPH
jgi:SAM-dependent methyltransferase